MIRTGATLPEVVLSLISTAKKSKEDFLNALSAFKIEDASSFTGKESHDTHEKYYNFILEQFAELLPEAKKDQLEKIVVDDFNFESTAQDLLMTQLLVEYKDTLKD